MKRHINSTGRMNLTADSVTISLRKNTEERGALSFDARLALPNKAFPENAKVYIEAYVKSSTQRFDFGTVAAPIQPKNTVLDQLDAGEPVRFRVKLVDDANGVGKILGWANDITASLNEGNTERYKSLLPLDETDLGQRVWALTHDGTGKPRLAINFRIPGLYQRLMVDPVLRGAIFPLVIEQVARDLLAEDLDEEQWVEDWNNFFENTLRVDLRARLEETNDVDGVAKEAVDAYCEMMSFADLAAIYTQGEQE